MRKYINLGEEAHRHAFAPMLTKYTGKVITGPHP